MSIEGKRRLAAFAFVALLILSVFWPSPAVSVNRLCCNAPIGVDELSFLGRESAPWDVAFWCIAGLFAIALIDPRADYREPLRVLRGLRIQPRAADALALLGAAALVAFTWLVLDDDGIAWAERVQSEAIEDVIRITNRFGGGMNPALIVGFFLLAGVAFRHRRWVEYAIAMSLAGLTAGILGQLIKALVGRARPELWLGPVHFTRGAASSFPSGHTVGAFALAGVIVFASPSPAMRVLAFFLAAAVGVSRILAFRHWPSDVIASAAVGLLVAWIVTRGVSQITSDPSRAA